MGIYTRMENEKGRLCAYAILFVDEICYHVTTNTIILTPIHSYTHTHTHTEF